MATGTCYVVARRLKAIVLSGHRRGWFDMRDVGAVLDQEEPHPPGPPSQFLLARKSTLSTNAAR
jgi:hypothetical protein